MLDWLSLAGLVIMWTALLLPGRQGRVTASKGDYSVFTEPGRRVLMPRQGERFLGRGRSRMRVVERRRRVFTVLLEGLGLTFLIGLFPPLRAMWSVTAVVAVALGAYVWLLLRIRAGRPAVSERVVRTAPAPPRMPQPQIPIITTPEFPVVGSGRDRRIVIISNPDIERRSPIAG